MEIHGPGGVHQPERPESQPARMKTVDQAVTPDRIVDHVEISEQAHYLEKLSHVPAIRQEKVAELQRQIEAGVYETPERIEQAVAKLLEEL